MAVLAFLCVFIAVANGARLEKAQERIPGQYIIRLKDTVNLDRFLSSEAFGKLNAGVLHKYERLNGLAVSLADQYIFKLLSLDAVEFVEEDGVAHAQQQVASWGLDRVDQRYLPLDDSFAPSNTGSDVTVYIIDTGLRHSHNDFGGRASYHWDYSPSNQGEDCNGHGTHCGGTATGTAYGVAKDANLKSVRVLSCSGSGSWSNVVAGILSVASAYGKRVGSMSLGGGVSQTVNDAVAEAVRAGAVMSLSAGNDDYDACRKSPASEPSGITVGATDINDRRAYFSNYGSCVDLFAPGVSITSAWYTSDSATNTISGTSMSCPHVSGAAAVFLACGVPALQVPSAIVDNATRDVVEDPGPDSPNLMLYVRLENVICPVTI